MQRLQREGNTMNLKAWLHSLAAAAISAFATSVTAAIVDPSNFNFTLAGFERLAAVGGLSAIVAVLALLKQSPLPDGTQVSASNSTGPNATINNPRATFPGDGTKQSSL